MPVTLDLFRHEVDARKFSKGEKIFSAGDAAENMYVVVEGEVELSVRGQVVEMVGPGGVFGEMALIDHAPRTATAIAMDGCALVAVPESRFMFMIQQTPHFALQIMRVITERLRRMDEKVYP